MPQKSQQHAQSDMESSTSCPNSKIGPVSCPASWPFLSQPGAELATVGEVAIAALTTQHSLGTRSVRSQLLGSKLRAQPLLHGHRTPERESALASEAGHSPSHGGLWRLCKPFLSQVFVKVKTWKEAPSLSHLNISYPLDLKKKMFSSVLSSFSLLTSKLDRMKRKFSDCTFSLSREDQD